MSDRPVGDETDHELRRAMFDLSTVPGPAPELDELLSPVPTLEGERTMQSKSKIGLIAAAAAIAAVVIGVIIFANGDDQGLDTIDRPDESTTTSSVAGTSSTTTEASGSDVDDTAAADVALAMDFITARASRDSDAVLALVADSASILANDEWIGSRDDYELVTRFEELEEWSYLNPQCQAGDPGHVVCTYEAATGLSSAFGLDSFQNSFLLEMADGQIERVNHARLGPIDATAREEVSFAIDNLVYIPFSLWVRENYPDEFGTMFSLGRPQLTTESLPLFDLRVPEFEAAVVENPGLYRGGDIGFRVKVALRFLEARNSWDGDSARNVVADAAIINSADEWIDNADAYLTLAKFERAVGMELRDVKCDGDTPSPITCSYTMATAMTEALGVGTYANTFVFDFPDEADVSGPQDVVMVGVAHDRSAEALGADVYDAAFIPWLEANHPDDVDLMFAQAEGGANRAPRITDDAVPLWELRVREFVTSLG